MMDTNHSFAVDASKKTGQLEDTVMNIRDGLEGLLALLEDGDQIEIAEDLAQDVAALYEDTYRLAQLVNNYMADSKQVINGLMEQRDKVIHEKAQLEADIAAINTNNPLIEGMYEDMEMFLLEMWGESDHYRNIEEIQSWLGWDHTDASTLAGVLEGGVEAVMNDLEYFVPVIEKFLAAAKLEAFKREE